MATAFFGEPKLKEAVMTRLEQHRRLDQFVQGIYFEAGRGCHLGCLTHSNDSSQKATERLFGIPERVAYWLEAVFEGLPSARCAWWAIEGTRAIPVGADLSLAHHRLAEWLLGDSGLLTIIDCNRAAIEQCRELHRRAALGEAVTREEWSAAWSAARSAAWSAAWSAAESAESAAWEKIAAKSIEIFSTSPISGSTGECEACVTATMAHLRACDLVRV